ncbi:MAG: GEVED domain-containing protein, partial [Cyanobacteria bacterium J06638_38]
MNILKLLAEVDLNHNQQSLKSQARKLNRRSPSVNSLLLRYYEQNLSYFSWLNHYYKKLPLRLFTLVILLSGTLLPQSADAQGGSFSDYGDTPSRYNNGDSGEHLTSASSGLYFGTVAPDGETAPQNSTDAQGDDNAGDDEDGITSFPTLTTTTSNYSLSVTVTNSGTSAANVYGWIDFDRDGEFDQDERASVADGTINLDSNGKVSPGSSGTVTLNWSGIGDPGANIINGASYVRVRTTTDDLSAAGQSTRRDSASVDTANNGEIEDYQLTINFSPLAEQTYCESIGGTVNPTNLFTELDSGTFGIGTSENESSSIDSGLTTYTYDANYPPNDGEYTVSTRRTTVGFGTWHTMTGHTTGDETDRFMVINANEDIADTEMVQSRFISGLTPNTNYTFTAYILNTVEVNPNHIDPNVSYGIDLQGVDDDGDGTIDEDREVEIRFSSGDIPESSQPTWIPYSFLFNTGDATAARFIIRNNVIGGFGNDLAIDDITLRGCDLTTGNLSGTLYYDTNSNGSLDTGEPGLPPGLTVRLIDDRGTANMDDDVIVTRLANPGGGFSFLNIPVGSNYRLEAPGDDGSGN